MSNNNNPTKFVLKFDLSAVRPSVTCEAAKFHSELIGDYKFSNVAHVKNLLIGHFVAREEEDATNTNTTNTFWVYNVKAKNTTTTVYRAPRLVFWPMEGDFETMQIALTTAKVPVSFFDAQIKMHLESVGIHATRENMRVYRDSYKEQLSKLLLTEILYKKSTVTIARWFDKINGNSYFSLNLNNGNYQINAPMQYGYGDAENLVIRALELVRPRNMRSGEFLTSIGMTVVDLGYKLKREMFQAAFHI